MSHRLLLSMLIVLAISLSGQAVMVQSAQAADRRQDIGLGGRTCRAAVQAQRSDHQRAGGIVRELHADSLSYGQAVIVPVLSNIDQLFETCKIWGM